MFISTLVAGLSMFMCAVPAQAALFDGSKDQACNGANLQDAGGCNTAVDQSNKVSSTLQALISILSIVVGIVAVIMLIIGGIRFVTSQGDGSSVAAARNTIIYAIVGIIVALMAQVIVKFVLGKASN